MEKRPNALSDELEGSSANLKKISTKINQDLTQGEIGKILMEARGTFEGTRPLVNKAKKDLEYLGLPETFGKGRVTLVQINSLAEKLTQTSETLNLLIERLYARPRTSFLGNHLRKDGTNEP